jgi:hypothetical protein
MINTMESGKTLNVEAMTCARDQSCAVTGAKPEYASERTGIFRCVFAFYQNRNVKFRCEVDFPDVCSVAERGSD